MTGVDFQALAILNPGAASGRVLKLSEPLSFWGGFDPKNGRILDRNHPEMGQNITASILVMPGSRGSAGTPGGVAEALRLKVGPAAIVLLKADVNITAGAQVADHLYGTRTPVLTLSGEDFSRLETGMEVTVTKTGLVTSLDCN